MDITSSDVQKYLLETSVFSKGMQNDTNHYVMKDPIDPLDLIVKNA